MKMNQIEAPPSYSEAVLVDCQRAEWNFEMCEACEQLDERIGHYKRVISAMTDQLTVDRITALVAELEARKAKLHRSRSEA